MNYDGADYFFLKNHLGSIMEITDIYQNTVKSYNYDAFGNIIGETGSLAHNAFTYTAREYHPRSGLYYYRARWYDPEVGRFMTQDPIGFEGGLNLYAYVANNPVNWIDPLGLGPFDALPIFAPEAAEIIAEGLNEYPGYVDFNITLGEGGGVTSGIMASDDGVYIYIGPALTTGPGGALTFAPLNEPTPGLNYGLQFGFLIGMQIGWAGEWFWELGIMSPGVTFAAYYVFPFFETKKM